jgi:hypothetical protein
LRINSEEKVSNFSISKLFFCFLFQTSFSPWPEKVISKIRKKYWPAAAA